MKNLIRSAVLLSAVLLLCAGALADEAPWCDMENCAFCKSISSRPDLMNSLATEIHDIAGGMVQTCVVAPAQMEAYRTAMAEMDATGKRLQAGEQMHLCGMCQSMGMLMMSGARFETVPTQFGSVEMLTSSAPETVEKIHAWAERTRVEMAKMMEAHKADAQN